MQNKNVIKQIFHLNYGLINYVDRLNHRANIDYVENPIFYTYLKDKKFSQENELRISLSAFGFCRFVLTNGSEFSFPESLKIHFDYKKAFFDKTIVGILFSQDGEMIELKKKHIMEIVPK